MAIGDALEPEFDALHEKVQTEILALSRLEKRSNLLLSTLRKTVEAMGGKLSLVAEFPDRPLTLLSGIAEDDSEPTPGQRQGT